MSCGNCGKGFVNGLAKVNKILSSWDRKKEDTQKQKPRGNVEIPKETPENAKEVVEGADLLTSDLPPPPDSLSKPVTEEYVESTELSTPQSISVSEALSVVFEIAPMSGKAFADLDDDETVFGRSSNKSMSLECEIDPDKPEGEEDGGTEAPQEEDNPLDLCLDCAETLTLLYNSYKDFTRICNLECEIAKRLEELERLREVEQLSQIQVRGVKRRKKQQTRRVAPKKSAKGGQQRGQKVEIKKEIQSEIEGGYSDMDLDLDDVDDGYYMESLSSSPPDSPVTLDTEAPPRSPRPVRNSSARNKDWSSYYRDDEFADEEEEGEVEAEGEEGQEGSEALGIEPDDGGEAATMEMLKNVEVEWEEGQDRDYEPDGGFSDDDDEEYKPDSDLEGLTQDIPKRKRGRPGRPPKRKHASMFKSFNRSMRRFSSRTPSGNFECLECGKFFAHKKSLERHCRSHTEVTAAVECPTCNKGFSRDDHLKRHRRVIHGEDIPMRSIRRDPNNPEEDSLRPKTQQKCPICDERFTIKEIDEHVSTHGEESPWKCKETECPMTFSVFNDFNKHKAVHYERQKALCEVCTKEFRGAYHMKRHQLSIHHVRSDKPVVSPSSDEEEEVEEAQFLDEQGNVIISIPSDKKTPKLFKCQECGKKYMKSEKLTEHLISHGIGERYRCEICGREFNHIRSKQRHMFLHSPENPYRCTQPGCDKGFSRKDHYVRHLQNMHNIDPPEGEALPATKPEKKVRVPPEKEVQCPHCDKVIKRERLRLHMVIHTGEKRHMCDLCGQKFGLRTTLLTHIQCVHQGVRRYTCTFCGQAFKRSNHLKDHEKLHTDADSKPFVCNICGKAFRREKNLKSHMICHIGSKDYMCEICGKAFNRIDNMRAHVKTVHQGLCIRKKKPSQSSRSAAVGVEVEVESDVLLPEGSVIMKVERPVGRKRQTRAKEPPPPQVVVESVETPPGLIPTTAVLVAVDPSNHPDHHEIMEQEIQEVGEEDSNNSYDPQLPQRTTIVQIGPNQAVITPQNPGQPFQGNFYYQYTYYNQL